MLVEGRHGGRKQLSACILNGEQDTESTLGNGTALLKRQSLLPVTNLLQ